MHWCSLPTPLKSLVCRLDYYRDNTIFKHINTINYIRAYIVVLYLHLFFFLIEIMTHSTLLDETWNIAFIWPIKNQLYFGNSLQCCQCNGVLYRTERLWISLLTDLNYVSTSKRLWTEAQLASLALLNSYFKVFLNKLVTGWTGINNIYCKCLCTSF